MIFLMRSLRACSCCGLVHQVPLPPRGHEAACVRCGSRILGAGGHPRGGARVAAISLAALILYPLALALPVMRIERLGHEHASSIWGGMVDLLADGQWFVGVAILLFSIVTPISKLAAMFVLCSGERMLAPSHRALTYRAVEFLGRWGMADVLLVALVVAMVKLGDIVTVTPGVGVVAFGAVVVLSLLASAAFDPHAIWEPSSGDARRATAPTRAKGARA